MATTMKKTTKPQTATVVSEEVMETVETTEEKVDSAVKEKKLETRKFKETDPIVCKSITSGELGMIGGKTGINYTWAGRGDETEVEYQDLVAAIRSGKKHITAPTFIIQDDDFLAQFPQVESIYSSMYSLADLKDVFKLSPTQMKKTIESLPAGAKESVKNIASTEISKGTLDSVQKIKVLDEIFDTKFMLMTELFG
jgi:hypothetical protein